MQEDVWEGVFPGFQGADLASDRVEDFCQGYGLGYGHENRRGSWNYAGQALGW